MSNLTSVAMVATARAPRYGKQLVSHLGRKSVGTWDDTTESGTLDMGDGSAQVALTSTPTALVIEVVANEATIATYEDVVGRHLVRFGERDELTVEWSRGQAASA